MNRYQYIIRVPTLCENWYVGWSGQLTKNRECAARWDNESFAEENAKRFPNSKVEQIPFKPHWK